MNKKHVFIVNAVTIEPRDTSLELGIIYMPPTEVQGEDIMEAALEYSQYILDMSQKCGFVTGRLNEDLQNNLKKKKAFTVEGFGEINIESIDG